MVGLHSPTELGPHPHLIPSQSSHRRRQKPVIPADRTTQDSAIDRVALTPIHAHNCPPAHMSRHKPSLLYTQYTYIHPCRHGIHGTHAEPAHGHLAHGHSAHVPHNALIHRYKHTHISVDGGSSPVCLFVYLASCPKHPCTPPARSSLGSPFCSSPSFQFPSTQQISTMPLRTCKNYLELSTSE